MLKRRSKRSRCSLLALAVCAVSLLAVPSAGAAQATYTPTSFDYDTGIDVVAGDTIVATASSNFNLCGGVRPCLDQTHEDGRISPTAYPVGPPFDIAGQGAGGGFYRIGAGAWTAFAGSPGDISVSNPVTTTSSGRLRITTNDITNGCESFNSPNGCYADNVGTILVTVTAADADADGVPDSSDNCVNAANSDQADSDHDNVGDVCDTFDNNDDDGDGVSNGGDNCPTDANSDQLDADLDGIGNACDTQDNADSDGDGVQNHADNCVDTPNTDQADANSSGLGDACDGDGDEVANAQDNCPSAANADQADVDTDGAGDACDSFDDRDTDSDGVKNGEDNCIADANPTQADHDGDGAGDACDAVNDLDGDSDGTDDDVDNCPTVANAGQLDSDNDGQGDACDTDDDGDGINDNVDACSTTFGTAANGCPMPTKKEQCLNNGFKDYGATFRNQGDCVSYVATRGKNQPAGAR